jgi:hypothetical protein
MSDFRDLFQTTDYTNFVPNDNQAKAIEKNFNFVKGSDLYKGIYDKCDSNIKNMFVRYYQIAMFNQHEDNDNYNEYEEKHGKRSIRSFLFKGHTGSGDCCYDYRVAEVKNYLIDEKDLDKFIRAIKKNKNNSEIKIIFKYYPVYDFTYTHPPTGDEINQCYSELLR